MPIVVPTGASPALPAFIANVRTDLFDAGQRAGDLPRWLDSDLARALDRANDRYSTTNPYLKQELIPTVALARLYAMPTDAWFVDNVEYPYGFYEPYSIPYKERNSTLISQPIASAGSLHLAGGGALSSGAYSWLVSFTVPGNGETTAVALASGTATAGQQATLDGIPTGPYGVTGRNIYRTQHGGSSHTLVASIADNSTTTYTDGASDASIASQQTSPNINSTQGIPQFEAQINEARLPSSTNDNGQDPNWGWLGLRYATKHELDANGTSIPERHWDILCLGAEMLAVYAYLIPTADNFHYVDGQFRDQVDDSKVPAAWLAVGRDLEIRFLKRLADLKTEDNATTTSQTPWGDRPMRWDRL